MIRLSLLALVGCFRLFLGFALVSAFGASATGPPSGFSSWVCGAVAVC